MLSGPCCSPGWPEPRPVSLPGRASFCLLGCSRHPCWWNCLLTVFRGKPPGHGPGRALRPAACPRPLLSPVPRPVLLLFRSRAPHPDGDLCGGSLHVWNVVTDFAFTYSKLLKAVQFRGDSH